MKALRLLASGSVADQRLLVLVLAVAVLPGCDSYPFLRRRPRPAQTPGQPTQPSPPPPTQTSPPPAPRKVAVLVAAEMADLSDLQNNSEFWYDTVLMYCMLRRNGFTDEDIYVLYGDGTDPSLAPPEALSVTGAAVSPTPTPDYYTSGGFCGDNANTGRITDYPMTVKTGPKGERELGCYRDDTGTWHCEPEVLFACLANGCEQPWKNFETDQGQGGAIAALTGNDYLFVWWKGHGTKSGGGGSSSQRSQSGGGPFELRVAFDSVTAAEVTGWIERVPAGHRLLVFETCKSGCLEGTWTTGDGTILLASSACDQSSFANDYHYDTWHGVFSFWIAGTLGGSLPPGSKNPMNEGTEHEHAVKVQLGQSVADAFVESKSATEYEVGHPRDTPRPIQSPLTSDPDQEAQGTRLDTDPPRPTPTPPAQDRDERD